MPCARRRSSLARRRREQLGELGPCRLVAHREAPRAEVGVIRARIIAQAAPRRPAAAAQRPTSIFVIFSLRAGPRGTCTETISSRLWPISALPTGDSLESLLLGRVGLGRADDRVLLRLAGLLVLDVHDRADLHDVGRDLGGVDDRARRASFSSSVGDARLEHRLLVLGVVVLGVLGDVAELACLLDALGDLAAAVGAQDLELVLELLEAFRGEDDVLGHACASGRIGVSERGSIATARRGSGRLSRAFQAAAASGLAARRRARAPRPASRPAGSARRRPSSRPGARGTRGRTCAGSGPARSSPRCSTARSMTQRSSATISACVGAPSRPPSSSANSHGLPSEPRASITAAAPVCA